MYIFNKYVKGVGFPGGSVGKESSCNAGDTKDTGSIPVSGRSPRGGNGHPLQYSCLGNSLIPQLVENPPAMQETPVRFLTQEDPLEKGQATHSSILGLPL